MHDLCQKMTSLPSSNTYHKTPGVNSLDAQNTYSTLCSSLHYYTEGMLPSVVVAVLQPLVRDADHSRL